MAAAIALAVSASLPALTCAAGGGAGGSSLGGLVAMASAPAVFAAAGGGSLGGISDAEDAAQGQAGQAAANNGAGRGAQAGSANGLAYAGGSEPARITLPAGDVQIGVPAGVGAFSIELSVSERLPFAGLEFGIEAGGAQAVRFESFSVNSAFGSAFMTPQAERGGVRYFGFTDSANNYAGSVFAGTLRFSYAGDSDEVLAITHMKVLRVSGSGGVQGELMPSPAALITVSRLAAGGDGDGDGENGNGANGGDSENDGSGGSGGGNDGDGESGSDSGDGDGNSGDGDGDGNSGGDGDSGDGSGNESNAGGGAGEPGAYGAGLGGAAARIAGNAPQTAIGDASVPLAGAGVPYGPSKYFSDVTDAYAWASMQIDGLYEIGVVNGIGGGLFNPAGIITRGDYTLMLVRAFGIESEFGGNFPDVAEGSYYYGAIGAARARGIARGYGDGTFRPDSGMTREEMMALTYRAAEAVGRPFSGGGGGGGLERFADREAVSEYALEAVTALVVAGIVIGDAGSINPQGVATRAETAVIMHRALTPGG
ncbi:MAG: S-layer homology domain-containing protein [Clostridiales bacterium]|nr:S-layer homology domain-containing protein [Clostridiales bacterium]